jgi:hypothetical protein
MVWCKRFWAFKKKEARQVSKKNSSLEELINKYLNAKGMEKKLLLAIIKRKFPEAKIPK